MENKKIGLYIWIPAVTLVLCVIFAVIISSAVMSPARIVETPKPERVLQQATQSGFVVRLEGNHVNVYNKSSDGETYSKTLSEVNIFDLPESTEQSLKGGVYVESNEALLKLIEDISS